MTTSLLVNAVASFVSVQQNRCHTPRALAPCSAYRRLRNPETGLQELEDAKSVAAAARTAADFLPTRFSLVAAIARISILHPSALLRIIDAEQRSGAFARFVADLGVARAARAAS